MGYYETYSLVDHKHYTADWHKPYFTADWHKIYDPLQGLTGIKYVPFLLLAVLGTCLCWLMVDVRRGRKGSICGKVSRDAGTWSNLMLNLWRDVFTNPYMLSLLPMFFVSTWYVDNTRA